MKWNMRIENGGWLLFLSHDADRAGNEPRAKRRAGSKSWL